MFSLKKWSFSFQFRGFISKLNIALNSITNILNYWINILHLHIWFRFSHLISLQRWNLQTKTKHKNIQIKKKTSELGEHKWKLLSWLAICSHVVIFVYISVTRVWVTLIKNNMRKREAVYWKWNVMNNETQLLLLLWLLMFGLNKSDCSCTVRFVSTHYCPYCNKTLQSFFWSWALLCTPHRLVVKSFKGSDAVALALSVVITTAAHHQCRNTIFSSSTLSSTARVLIPSSRRAWFDSNGFPFKCFPRRWHGDREIVAVVVIRRVLLKGAFQRKLPHYCCQFSPSGFPTTKTGLIAKTWLTETSIMFPSRSSVTYYLINSQNKTFVHCVYGFHVQSFQGTWLIWKEDVKPTL